MVHYVLCYAIKSVNGCIDQHFKILNKTFDPLGVKKQRKDTIYLLWSSTYKPIINDLQFWKPNHLVPLLETKFSRFVDLENSNEGLYVGRIPEVDSSTLKEKLGDLIL